MKPRIVRPDKAAEYYFVEGCHILEEWNTAEDSSVSLARARVAPGITTKAHRLHGVVERYLIDSGQGIVRIGDLPPLPVEPGDVIIIPAGIRQQITNTGTTDLIFHCICTPRFTKDCYKSLEPEE